MNTKIKIGKFGQQLAAKFLFRRNYEIITENFYCQFGEIDIIAQKEKQLVFVEVKTRLSDKYGLPEEALTKSKYHKLYQSALKYLETNQINNDNFRLDCLAVEINLAAKKAQIRHHKNIII